jgi:signal transduction histidine kinase
MARNEIQENRVSLETKLASDLPLISGDKVQLQQVVLNLLINAVEAMGESAEGPRNLTVSSEMAGREAATGPGTAIRDQIGFPEEPSQTPARGGNEGGHVLITVKDSGPGLDLQGLHRLFDAFYTTKRHGLGMGLAISRSIIQAHGGRLWAKPNTPRGAVFQFTLPVQQYTEFQ